MDTTDYVTENDEKPLPDFHGEPVPEDEDDDDELFEIAAGMRPNKKKDEILVIEDEPLPDDEFIELDYCYFLVFDFLNNYFLQTMLI